MKKTIICIVILVMLAALSACGEGDSSVSEQASVVSNTDVTYAENSQNHAEHVKMEASTAGLAVFEKKELTSYQAQLTEMDVLLAEEVLLKGKEIASVQSMPDVYICTTWMRTRCT